MRIRTTFGWRCWCVCVFAFALKFSSLLPSSVYWAENNRNDVRWGSHRLHNQQTSCGNSMQMIRLYGLGTPVLWVVMRFLCGFYSAQNIFFSRIEYVGLISKRNIRLSPWLCQLKCTHRTSLALLSASFFSLHVPTPIRTVVHRQTSLSENLFIFSLFSYQKRISNEFGALHIKLISHDSSYSVRMTVAFDRLLLWLYYCFQ